MHYRYPLSIANYNRILNMEESLSDQNFPDGVILTGNFF